MAVLQRLALLVVFALAGCGSLYGADFDYPESAPVPRGATVLATDTGEDDDSPIRSRQQILDLGAATQADLLASYRQHYPASAGWRPLKVRGDQQLCLVNRARSAYVEVVEIYRYAGTRVRVTPTRRLVTVSRIERPDPDVCGFSLAWTNTDLFLSKKDQTSGTIAGRLLVTSEPGATPAPVSPGLVTLSGETTVSTKVDRDGRFVMQAPPGRYDLAATGRTPTGKRTSCRSTVQVISEEMVSSDVDVICRVR